MKSELVDLEVGYLHNTEKAVLITPDGKREIWLPLSIVECDLTNVGRGQVIEIILPRRWALDKGLI
jgi:hypothetical protein